MTLKTFTKEQLLFFVLEAPQKSAVAMLVECRHYLRELDAHNAGFTPFPRQTVAEEFEGTYGDVLTWVKSVQQPKDEADFADRERRNMLVYEVEKLGEFTATLQARTSGTMFDYVRDHV